MWIISTYLVSYAFNWFVYVAQGPSGPRLHPIQLRLID